MIFDDHAVSNDYFTLASLHDAGKPVCESEEFDLIGAGFLTRMNCLLPSPSICSPSCGLCTIPKESTRDYGLQSLSPLPQFRLTGQGRRPLDVCRLKNGIRASTVSGFALISPDIPRPVLNTSSPI